MSSFKDFLKLQSVDTILNMYRTGRFSGNVELIKIVFGYVTNEIFCDGVQIDDEKKRVYAELMQAVNQDLHSSSRQMENELPIEEEGPEYLGENFDGPAVHDALLVPRLEELPVLDDGDLFSLLHNEDVNMLNETENCADYIGEPNDVGNIQNEINNYMEEPIVNNYSEIDEYDHLEQFDCDGIGRVNEAYEWEEELIQKALADNQENFYATINIENVAGDIETVRSDYDELFHTFTNDYCDFDMEGGANNWEDELMQAAYMNNNVCESGEGAHRSGRSASTTDVKQCGPLPQQSQQPQIGGGDDNGLKYIVVEDESSRLIRKFGLLARSIQFKLGTFNGDKENPISWLEKAVNELLAYAARECLPDDLVGITLQNENFENAPLGISFRRLSQLNSDVIFGVVQAVLQSNQQFFDEDRLTIRLDRVRLPTGHGYSKLSKRNVDKNRIYAEKRSIFVVENDDSSCLAYALVVALENINNKQGVKILKKNKALLKAKAEQLCRDAGVDLTSGGNLNHVRNFQNYFKNEYSIVVYNDLSNPKSILFEGPCVYDRPTLDLLFDQDHYNVILSRTGAFSTVYFCNYCRLRFNTKERHYKCKYICPCCHAMPPCPIANEKISCPKCNRVFRGGDCFKKHEANKVCKKLQNCKKCLTYMAQNEMAKHKCGFKFCKICMKDKPVDHLCYMPTKKLKQSTYDKKIKSAMFMFYDIETMQDKPFDDNGSFLHTPNLCVSQQLCEKCFDNPDFQNECENCGTRQNIFKGSDCVDDFLDHVVEMSIKFNVTAIAHNMRGFDGCFVLQSMFGNKGWKNVDVIRSGAKILHIKVGEAIRFVDSLNFIPLPLAKMPSAFKFDECKGFFPHFFNKEANANYIGQVPDAHYFGCDTMKPADRSTFLEWHSKMRADNYVFNMAEEIVKYCVMDVAILRTACMKFRSYFLEIGKVDPLLETFTMASTCNLTYARNYLKEDTIGIIPKNGYRLTDRQSAAALKWLSWVSHSENIDIRHAGVDRELRLPGGYMADGYCKATNTIYEYLGCYWHGCERCHFDQTAQLKGDKHDTMATRRERTLSRENHIKQLGYNVVSMWECDWNRIVKSDVNIQKFVDSNSVTKHTPLNPRDAFFGGRTNACKLYHKCDREAGEKIHYYDYTSLYPFVNKYIKLPLFHPRIYVGHAKCKRLPLDTVEGLIKCSVLPPQNLYHPVLPIRINDKLMFPLCRTCAESENQDECCHNPEERQFVGTFVADELRKAVSLGYSIVEYHEIWEYKVTTYDKVTKTGGLFAEYVNNFLKVKQECSGWPSWCKTDLQKELYLAEYEMREGIKLDRDSICKNPGLRYVAKLILNCLWGKFGQREDKSKTEIIRSPGDLFKLMTNPSVLVTDLTPINQEVLLVTWKRTVEEDIEPLKTVNVAIAAYTTSAARLQLYNCLEKLGERVYYYDTDSVIFTCRPGEYMPPTGDYLGDLTDEIAEYGPGSYIDEFVSGGPKNYGYKVRTPDKTDPVTVCKVKGITLNYLNSQKVNFDVMKTMICDGGSDVILEDPHMITRTKSYDVVSKPQKKKYGFTFTKRRMLNDSYDTLPYGYKLNP